MEASAPDVPSQIVMALDLTEALDPIKVRGHLNESKALEQNPDIDKDAVAQLIAGARGIRFTARVTDSIQGQLTVDFSNSPKVVGKIAKDLLLEALSNLGYYLEDTADWDVTVGDRSVSIQGKLSTPALREIATLVHMASPNVQAAKMESREKSDKPDQPDQPGATMESRPTAEATKAYLTAVQTLTGDLRGRKSKTWKDLISWYQSTCRQIDSLPMLGVDPDVLNYGAQVSSEIRAIAGSLQGISIENSYIEKQKKTIAPIAGNLYNMAGISSYGWNRYGVGGYGAYGYAGATWSGFGYQDNGAAAANAGGMKVAGSVLQMRNAQDTLIAQGKTSREQLWNLVDEQTYKIRRMMTEKYKTEF